MIKIIQTLLITFLLASNYVFADPSKTFKLQDGVYSFHHKFAEQNHLTSIEFTVKIKGSHIVVINNDSFDIFPRGIIEEGTLMWHSKSGHWIIGTSQKDLLEEVGGCSGGPTIVDLKNKIYWTC